MAKKVNVVGAKPKRVKVADKPKRRIEPVELAAALGAAPDGEFIGANLDLISLAELGTELLNRLRSTGGRPALADATEICRVPLSADDLKALETITEQIEKSTGTKPSPGQVASVIVRDYLKSQSAQKVRDNSGKGNGNRSPICPPAWLPQLNDIAAQAVAMQKTAGAIESAAKGIKEGIDREIA